MTNYYTADLHMGHNNLCKGSTKWPNSDNCRPFSCAREMDKLLIHNINKLVQPDDTLYILGDFSLGCSNKIKAYREYRSQIKCKNIIYIRGNHSPRNYDNYAKDKEIIKELEQIFTEVHEVLLRRIDKQLLFMSHYAMRVWDKQSHGAINLFGHSHHSLVDDITLRAIDVGIDGSTYDWFPITIEKILEIVGNRPFIKKDHH